MNYLEKPLFLQSAINICQRIEVGENKVNAFPFLDIETQYLLSTIEEPIGIKWIDCKINNQPNWLAYKTNATTLYLKNKISQKVYYLSL